MDTPAGITSGVSNWRGDVVSNNPGHDVGRVSGELRLGHAVVLCSAIRIYRRDESDSGLRVCLRRPASRRNTTGAGRAAGAVLVGGFYLCGGARTLLVGYCDQSKAPFVSGLLQRPPNPPGRRRPLPPGPASLLRLLSAGLVGRGDRFWASVATDNGCRDARNLPARRIRRGAEIRVLRTGERI